MSLCKKKKLGVAWEEAADLVVEAEVTGCHEEGVFDSAGKKKRRWGEKGLAFLNCDSCRDETAHGERRIIHFRWDGDLSGPMARVELIENLRVFERRGIKISSLGRGKRVVSIGYFPCYTGHMWEKEVELNRNFSSMYGK